MESKTAWGGRYQSKLSQDVQAHSKVGQGSWARSSPCLCRDEEIDVPQPMWFLRYPQTGRKVVLFSYV